MSKSIVYSSIFETAKENAILKYGQLDPEGFHEGLCSVLVGDKWGFINRSGDMVIEPRFVSAESFENGLAKVLIDDWEHQAIIDHSGKVLRTF